MTQIGLMYEKEKIEYGNQRALEEKIKITKILLQEGVDTVMIMKATGFTEEELLCIQDGTKPKFMENLVISPSYYEQPDPYANAPSCHVNLLELSRYAKQCGKSWLNLHRRK